MATTSQIAEELIVLARTGDALSAAAAKIPGLRRLAEERFGPSNLDAIQLVIDDAAESLDRTQREAVIEVFGGSEHRFINNFSARRRRAGEILGIGESKFRRKRPTDDASPFDDLAHTLAAAILARHDQETTIASVASPPPEPPTRGTRRALLTAAAVVGAIVAGVAGLLAWTAEDDDNEAAAQTAPTTSGDATVTSDPDPEVETEVLGESQLGQPIEGCDIPVGAAIGIGSPSVEIVEAAARAYTEEHQRHPLGCPHGLLEPWDSLWVQEVEMADGSLWRITVEHEAPEQAHVLSETLFLGYRRILDGDNGTMAQGAAGLPRFVDNRVDGPHMTTSNGSLVIGETHDVMARWLAPEAVSVWEGLGGIEGPGYPITDAVFVEGSLRQDFERAYGVVEEGEVRPVTPTAEQLAADLADLPRQTEIILEGPDKNSWWIDADRTRHWIDSVDTWHCLGGHDVSRGEHIYTAGWVIGQFALGGIAECVEAS